jgi:hypothetical protein
MKTDTINDVPPAARVSFAIACTLAVIAAYNYATGVYGGAIVSSVGTALATLFGILA